MANLLSNYKIRGEGGAGSVVSVNSKTGAVVLTKADIYLGNVENTSDLQKPISVLTQIALDGKVDKITGKGLSANDFTNVYKTLLDNLEMPTKESIGLGNVDNTSDLNKPLSNQMISALAGKVNTISGKSLSTEDFTTAYKNQLDNLVIPPAVTKESLGLGNVDNTSDLDKPISTLTQEALAALQLQIDAFEIQEPNGLSLEISNGSLDININGQDVLYTVVSDITQINVIKPIPPIISKSVAYITQGHPGNFISIPFPSNWNWINGSPLELPTGTNKILRLSIEVDPVGNIYALGSIINLG